MVCTCSRSDSRTGENGSSSALFSPAVYTRRSTPSFSAASCTPKLAMITPMEPTMLAGSA